MVGRKFLAMTDADRREKAKTEIEKIEPGASGIKWLIMLLLPPVLFVATLFLGRYYMPPDQILGILKKNLLHLPIVEQ